MDFMEAVKLEGDEVLATIFHPEEDDFMILATGEKINEETDGLLFLHLYAFEDGVPAYGIDTFAFPNREMLEEFLVQLPNMSAMDYIIRGIGVRPEIR